MACVTRWVPRIVTRTRSLLAAALAVVLGAAGCTDKRSSASEPPDPQPGTPVPTVDFTATVEPGADAVHVVYRLVNKSGGELLAFKSDKVYVTGQDNGRVQLAQRAFAMPEGDVT